MPIGRKILLFFYRRVHNFQMMSTVFTASLYQLQAGFNRIIIWKAQGVPQLNNVAHPKHPEEEETSPNRNHIFTGMTMMNQ